MDKRPYKKPIVFFAMIMCVVLLGVQFSQIDVSAKTVKLSVKSKTITQGKTFKVTVRNASKKIKVSVSKKNIVKIKKIKKNQYRITGKKAGRVKIYFKVGNKKYKCTVKVKKKQTPQVNPGEKPTSPIEKPTEPETTLPQETEHVHQYVKEIERKDAACGTEGHVIYQCECGLTHTEIINPTREHQLTPWIIDNNPTESQNGLRHKECIYCHKIVFQESIPKLPEKPLDNAGDKTGDDEDIDVGDAFQ